MKMVDHSHFSFRNFAFTSLFFLFFSLPCSSQHILGSGYENSFYICNNGNVYASGEDVYSQLGDYALAAAVSTPKLVTGLTASYTQVAGGYYHGMALKNDGTIKSWGRSDFGQCGDGNGAPPASKAVGNVINLTSVTAISAGALHSMALKSDGSVWVWGYNLYGQIGDNTSDGGIHPTPIQVHGPLNAGFLTNIVAIAAGEYYCLALDNTGKVWGWGQDASGQLGDGTAGANSLYPVQVVMGGPNNVTRISTKANHSMFLQSDGTVWICGENGSRQLGDNTTVDKATPFQVLAATYTKIAAGGNFSLAFKSDGTLRAWGTNTNYQLGDGTTAPSGVPITPTHVFSGTVVDIAAGALHAFALKSNGSAQGWGRNVYGQMGNGNTTTDATLKTLLFAGGGCTTILPVDVVSFSGTFSKSIVKLSWQTASEINNDYFSVERSMNGSIWESIGTVKGFGNSTTLRDYEFMDETPVANSESQIYYRLKQTDHDGELEYFGPIGIQLLNENEWSLVLQNTPAADQLSCTVYAPEESDLEVGIYDLHGKAIVSKAVKAFKGSNLLQFDLENFSDGIYFIKITSPKGKHLENKFMKKSG